MPNPVRASSGTVDFHPTEHWQGQLFGLTFNVDTIIGTAVAAAVILAVTYGRPIGSRCRSATTITSTTV
ncbi:MAG: hypothetical protein ACRDRL_27755 [Sciscionella sp.]